MKDKKSPVFGPGSSCFLCWMSGNLSKMTDWRARYIKRKYGKTVEEYEADLSAKADIKLCRKCATEKPLSAFDEEKRNTGNIGKGRASRCKECRRSEESAWREAHPEQVRRYQKVYSDDEVNKSRRYALDIERKYGISLSEYEAMLSGQGDRCAVCRCGEPDGQGRWHVDHQHVEGWARLSPQERRGFVRGLLCHGCNTGTKLTDNPSLLRAKADYISNFRPPHPALGPSPSPSPPVCPNPQLESGIRTSARILMDSRPGMCYQRAIRESIALREGIPDGAPLSMAGASVTPITREQASSIILKYEWLGTMGHPQASYGLWLPINGTPTLAGAVCFGFATGKQAGTVCGSEFVDKAIALERGTCVHWAPKDAASWFVSRAVAMAAKEHGWLIFYAYSDPAAGEVGTIYQACNWIYLGQGPGHGPTRTTWTRPDGIRVTSRSLRARHLKTKEALAQGWQKEVVPSRGKYVWFEAPPLLKKSLRKRLLHPVMPYPKRVPKPGLSLCDS